ncbi:hypothetical protein [Cytobacillus sp. IB215665]|uniref:hypothetical protein n=1 Tax=Cytobacillus sp. IB215665 TaxID=3097357 RepID=UPI002A15C1F0|nr:hypothetical protein [Cytobacillus sp. IB215665]MDX8367699.1 hypothetical protein [Cytobacillus sp. IB215665]
MKKLNVNIGNIVRIQTVEVTCYGLRSYIGRVVGIIQDQVIIEDIIGLNDSIGKGRYSIRLSKLHSCTVLFEKLSIGGVEKWPA